MMRIARTVFIVTICCAPFILCALQSPTNGVPAQGAPAAPVTPSGILRPSLDSVQQAIGALRIERWKKGTVREEADANINDIQRDLKTTLPPILGVADAAPGTLSKVLPVSRNIDALYDVLLRVVEAARVSAPADQVTQLQQALIALGNARRALSDHLEESAAAQEKQVSDLRVTVQTQLASLRAAKAAPVTTTCVAPTPPRRAKKKSSTTAKSTKTPPPLTKTTTPPNTGK